MKLKYIFVLLTQIAASLISLNMSWANSESFTTGKEWVEKMSKGEKFISVYAPMILFHRYGINFRKTPQEYINTIDSVLLNNPYLEKEDVSNIFASTIYAYEPESRRAFQILEMQFQDPLSPYLLLEKNREAKITQADE